jgi:nitroreductase
MQGSLLMHIIKAILKRRRIRKIEQKPIHEDALKEILPAAMQAPSAGNQQLWEFINSW